MVFKIPEDLSLWVIQFNGFFSLGFCSSFHWHILSFTINFCPTVPKDSTPSLDPRSRILHVKGMRSTGAQEQIFKNKIERSFSLPCLPFLLCPSLLQLLSHKWASYLPVHLCLHKPQQKKISFLKIIFKKKREEIHLLFFLKI